MESDQRVSPNRGERPHYWATDQEISRNSLCFCYRSLYCFFPMWWLYNIRWEHHNISWNIWRPTTLIMQIFIVEIILFAIRSDKFMRRLLNSEKSTCRRIDKGLADHFNEGPIIKIAIKFVPYIVNIQFSNDSAQIVKQLLHWKASLSRIVWWVLITLFDPYIDKYKVLWWLCLSSVNFNTRQCLYNVMSEM